MNKIYNYEPVNEGSTKVFVFKKKLSKKGPGSKDKLPFYNPAMELNRDLSVIVGQWFVDNSNDHVRFLDGLASSGIRGFRLANEIDGDFEVMINDWDDDAFALINKNMEYCKLDNVVVSNSNLNTVLSENKFNYIDIDPFGSPVYFIDSALRSIYNNGIISCTATDTATLCGVYPKVCLRRYGALPFHSFMMHETGLRILIGFICRAAGKYDMGIEPLVSYSTDHYFRVYLKIKKGVKKANDSIKMVSCINSDKLCLSSKNTNSNIGPLWMGKLHNKHALQEMRTILFKKKLGTKHMVWKLLDLLEEEADAPAFYYTTDELASMLKCSPVKMKNIFEKLRSKGYVVTRTHFYPTGFKTDTPRDIIEKIFGESIEKN